MDILEEMRRDRRFKVRPEVGERQWYMYDGEGKEVAFVYFKHAFGGWNILDNGERTPVNSIADIEKYLTVKMVNKDPA
jgi:hypothetical protein